MDTHSRRDAKGDSRYDVVIIGGGINGTSAARELAAGGYKVLLTEMSDLANGASSRSSRILHCGLRYFETAHPVRTFLSSPRRLAGAMTMARAAMQARAELSDLKPDNCKPFTMCFPLYSDGDVKGWHLDLGFGLLKRLGPARPPLDYRRITRDFDQLVPFAGDLRDRESLRSIATYREYIIDSPDRLCVEAALEAERNGAELRLFTKAGFAGRSADGHWLLQLSSDGGTDLVEAPVVLNLAGTWSDGVIAGIVDEPRSPLVTGTKGSHIVVRLPQRYAGHGIACLHRGGMPFYCLPLDGDLFYFGPTETKYDGDAGDAVATDDDISFLLEEANFLLPGLGLRKSHVEFTWAGVRPLGFDARQPMGRRIREIHDLADRGMPGVFAMTAGPVMSHLSAGRELRDVVARALKPSGQPRARRPGTPSSRPRPDPAQGSAALLRHAVIAEHARDLKGILYTRTGMGWGRHLDRDTVQSAAEAVSDLLGWSQSDVSAQVESFLRYQNSRFAR
ncbi:FAD-dependent oxidoreductase [Methylobacterium nodulans]|uniref:FAD dependent oxidoreductase n=1 Tax=Methylobacterium nodulans (strain LMG 21967 / CNCM I-2342 / ORS 2060) TaxID=460265 RepID=B8IWW7_METNO|nr:FAD-dependent oxidoreductase [Methylobacterium nodulans]ACL63008.1 FAD dependent oxidoreductase [Methylobacterium nodulans ORS 2060]